MNPKHDKSQWSPKEERPKKTMKSSLSCNTLPKSKSPNWKKSLIHLDKGVENMKHWDSSRERKIKMVYPVKKQQKSSTWDS